MHDPLRNILHYFSVSHDLVKWYFSLNFNTKMYHSNPENAQNTSKRETKTDYQPDPTFKKRYTTEQSTSENLLRLLELLQQSHVIPLKKYLYSNSPFNMLVHIQYIIERILRMSLGRAFII